MQSVVWVCVLLPEDLLLWVQSGSTHGDSAGISMVMFTANCGLSWLFTFVSEGDAGVRQISVNELNVFPICKCSCSFPIWKMFLLQFLVQQENLRKYKGKRKSVDLCRLSREGRPKPRSHLVGVLQRRCSKGSPWTKNFCYRALNIRSTSFFCMILLFLGFQCVLAGIYENKRPYQCPIFLRQGPNVIGRRSTAQMPCGGSMRECCMGVVLAAERKNLHGWGSSWDGPQATPPNMMWWKLSRFVFHQLWRSGPEPNSTVEYVSERWLSIMGVEGLLDPDWVF